MSLAEALERAAAELPGDADAIRPANGDPHRLLDELDAEAAPRVLRWLLDHECEAVVELLHAWSEEGGAGSAAVLAVDEQGLGKAGRKALRRARHQLRSRGLGGPEPAPEQRVRVLPPVETALDEAMLSPLDPRGARAVYLVLANPAGGARLFELILDPARGVLDCRVYAAARGRVRRFLRESEREGPLAAVAVEPALARALVAASAAAQPKDRPLPRTFSEWRRALTADPAPETPGEQVRAALGAEPEPARLRAVSERVARSEIGPWPPDSERLAPLADRLAEAGRSELVVSAAQRRERLDAVLGEGLEELFPEPFARATAVRFEETAFVLWKRERVEEARDCLAAAAAFRAGDPRENPVARALVETVLAPVLGKLEEELGEDEGKSHLVQP